MDKATMALLIPIIAVSIGLVGAIGHYVQNYLRMKHGYAPLGGDGKEMDSLSRAAQDQIVRLKAEVDQLRHVKDSFAALEDRVRTLEKIVTDPTQRLASEIERLK